jgi:hypothetical protein
MWPQNALVYFSKSLAIKFWLLNGWVYRQAARDVRESNQRYSRDNTSYCLVYLVPSTAEPGTNRHGCSVVIRCIESGY